MRLVKKKQVQKVWVALSAKKPSQNAKTAHKLRKKHD